MSNLNYVSVFSHCNNNKLTKVINKGLFKKEKMNTQFMYNSILYNIGTIMFLFYLITEVLFTLLYCSWAE